MGEVEHAVRHLRNCRALGDSWVSAELLKVMSPSFSSVLALVFNQVRRVGPPSGWNHLCLLSLFKKGDSQDPNNYRGLAIMSALPKLFATIMMHRVE